MELYKTDFTLTHPIVGEFNLREAKQYLEEDDMTKYLLTDRRISREPTIKDLLSKVIEISWKLEDSMKGSVFVFSTQELSLDEQKFLSGWVSGQNSDGLGEGFEQQDFAVDFDADRSSSFDWMTNTYTWEKVS